MTAFVLQKMQSNMACYRKVLCALLLANPAIIFSQRHIKDPMQRLFYPPMLAHGLGTLGDIVGQRRQVIARRPRPLVTPSRRASTMLRLCKWGHEAVAPSPARSDVIP
jgi:hypothetical protein